MLPAYAGMSPSPSSRPEPMRGAPRLRGDEPAMPRGWSETYPVLPAYAGMSPVAPEGDVT